MKSYRRDLEKQSSAVQTVTNDTGKTGFVQWMSRFYSPACINQNVIAQRFYKAIAFTIHVWLPNVPRIFVTNFSTVGFIPLGITCSQKWLNEEKKLFSMTNLL